MSPFEVTVLDDLGKTFHVAGFLPTHPGAFPLFQNSMQAFCRPSAFHLVGHHLNINIYSIVSLSLFP